MKTTLVLLDEKDQVVTTTEISGGHDLQSTCRMVIGRTMAQLDKRTDVRWSKAQINVDRWLV